MPAWAVALAIGGGLVVGFVFLRGSSSGAASSDGEGDAAAAGGGPASSGSASGAPIPWDQLLSGLGITSPDYVPPSYTDQAGGGGTVEQQQEAAAASTAYIEPTGLGGYLSPAAQARAQEMGLGGDPLATGATAPAASSPDWAERAAARGQSAGATVSTWSISGAAGAGTGAGVQTVPTVATPTRTGSVQG